MIWWFILAVICIFIAAFFVKESFELPHYFDFKDWRCWIGALLFIVIWFGFCLLATYYISRYNEYVADYAIDQYVMGNVEKTEIIKNGEVVDYHYKIIKTDCD